MIFPERYCLFAGSATEEHLDKAKRYVKDNGLTSDDVKIVSNGEEMLVVTKREVELL